MNKLKTGDKVRIYHGITGKRLTDWVAIKVPVATAKAEDKKK